MTDGSLRVIAEVAETCEYTCMSFSALNIFLTIMYLSSFKFNAVVTYLFYLLLTRIAYMSSLRKANGDKQIFFDRDIY